MSNTAPNLRDLLDRVARLIASEGWGGDLNPTQRAALGYLARANRFSRAPSHVADYLLITRGTASQTLKALGRKGLVREVRSDADRRSISLEVTEDGAALADTPDRLDSILDALPSDTVDAVSNGLSDIVSDTLAARGGRSFGLCRTCRHHDPRGGGGHCLLLGVDLAPPEATQLCHEHSEAA